MKRFAVETELGSGQCAIVTRIPNLGGSDIALLICWYWF